MIIRPAVLSDLNSCLAIDHGSVTDHVWQMRVHETDSTLGVTFHTVRLPRRMQAEYPRSLDQLLEDWERGEGFFAAEVDGEVRGYIDLVALKRQRLGWIVNLAVDTGFRLRGIGAGLVSHAARWSKDQGLGVVIAEATTKNYPALCFYQKVGFQFCGFSDHYYPNQDIALFFENTLR